MEKKRILWVDTNASIVKPFTKKLEAFGFKVRVESSVDSGLKQFCKRRDWDLVILEVIMPPGSLARIDDIGKMGLLFMKKIREINQAVQVVFFTIIKDPVKREEIELEAKTLGGFLGFFSKQDEDIFDFPKKVKDLLE